MSELVWPERKRCRACRKYFRKIVLRRLYCSYECAGVPEPDPDIRPRQCFSKVPWIGFQPKRPFFSPEEALTNHAALTNPEMKAYECPRCFMYHLGHEYMEMSAEDFLELVRQRREEKTRAQEIREQERKANLIQAAEQVGLTPEQMLEFSQNGRLLDPEAERIRIAARDKRRKAKKRRKNQTAKKRRKAMENPEPWQLKLLQIKDQLPKNP